MKCDLVSIIIPIYNVEKYLDKCLKTIINQTYKNIEIILVDDGSTDNSLFICNKYAEDDKRIKVLHKKNEGVSVARNIGIKLSTGKFVVFVDPDDYVSNNHIETLYNCIISNNVDLVISNAINVTEDGNMFKNEEKKDFFMNKEECLKELLSENNFSHVCWGNIYKRELLEVCSFNDKYRIAEDLDFLYEYISNIESGYFLSKNTYYWLMREGSATNSQYSEKWNDELEICKSIIERNFDLQSDLYHYAIEKYIRMNFNQVQRFSLNKKQIKLFRDNIKVYKKEAFNGNRLSKGYKLKIIIFLKSYRLYKVSLKIKDKIKSVGKFSYEIN